LIPGDVGIGLLLLALVPGWLYLRLRERLRPQSGSTGLGELIEILAVGLATTGVAAFILLVVLPHGWLPFLLDVEAWAKGGETYLLNNVRLAAATALVILAAACAIAYGVYSLKRLRTPSEFRPQGSVWVHALGARPKGTVPWVGLKLDDGRLVEGLLHSYSLTEGAPEMRDIALQPPMRVTDPGQLARPLSLNRLIVSGKQIAEIAVVHAPEAVRPAAGLLARLRRWGASRVWARLRRQIDGAPSAEALPETENAPPQPDSAENN
jgi:hypothetical protein